MGIAAVASFFGSFFAELPSKPSWPSFVLASWLVVPPIYFFIEFHRVRSKFPEQLEYLKESQASAEKIWAGVAAALAVLYFKS